LTPRPHVPTRTLKAKPDLSHLKRQAKELLDAFIGGDAVAIAEVGAHFQGARAESFALHHAQQVIARAYGFPSWPKIKAYVDGVTIQRFVIAAGTGDLEAVRRMAATRPELVHLDVGENDEHQALHHAVIGRHPSVVQFLMQMGANARKGIYPHRDATSALTLAVDRGYTEIEAIIREEEARRPLPPPAADLPGIDALRVAFQRGDEEAVITCLAAHPQLTRAANSSGRSALHWATGLLWERFAAWLIAQGANVHATAANGDTALDVIGREHDLAVPEAAAIASRLVTLLRAGGAAQTAKGAVAAGDAEWLRGRHREGRLLNERGLAEQAVKVERPEMLALLLDLGYDPDESGIVGGLEETVPTWGGPLRSAVIRGSLEMVHILLGHGANPNTNVYAASCAMSEARQKGHPEILAALERHGGRFPPLFVADLGLTDVARQLLEGDPNAPVPPGFVPPGSSVQMELLWGAMGHPSPEIIRLTLARTNWPRDDGRWYRILENGLYFGPTGDRGRRLEAFSLVLARANPDVEGPWGTTLLHQIVASRGGLAADDRLALATMVLDAGARLDVRDRVLRSTPLGWACRWGREELVTLFLARGADPVESHANEWARPRAWALARGHRTIVEQLDSRLGCVSHDGLE
jgi:ankyrin repeat protein